MITKSGPRVFRVMIDRAEQDFYFNVESVPLAVSFDRFNRVLKRLSFDRPKEDLIYLLKRSDDVTARLRAARELGAFSGRDTIDALKEAIEKDRFWGVKVAALSALGEVGGDEALDFLSNVTTARPTRWSAAGPCGASALIRKTSGLMPPSCARLSGTSRSLWPRPPSGR